MKSINAADLGICPDKDITEQLFALLESLKNISEEKTVCFSQGTYFIDSEKCKKHMLYITNTVGDNEFSADETPHLNAVPFYFNGIRHLVLDGNNSIFVIRGKVTNIAMEDCSDIALKNIEIRHAHPDMHELKVTRKSLFSVEFDVDKDSVYEVKDGRLYFKGTDYDCAADKNALNAHWIGLIRRKTPNILKRVAHPLIGCTGITDLKNGRVRAKFLNTCRFKTGDCYYLFDVRRQFAGIFVNRCKNIELDNIKQRFNYSLALVAQDSENLSLIHSEFAPEKNAPRKMASVADFIQICMCRGNVVIDSNRFDGAGDDCLNVHGIHFKITEKKDNQITVRFMHPQSHGFNPLRAGDTVAFVNPKTLLETAQASIIKSELMGEYEIRLTLDSAEQAIVGDVIEDISACPNVTFSKNTLNRIITRGLLLTTRGKVLVEDNRFISTSMSSILLSDDAKSWYESGMCCDVTIRNNTIEYCGQTPILIKPENSVHSSAVHKNIRILGNTFKNYKGFCIQAKSSDNIEIQNNRFHSGKIIQQKNCGNVSVQK